MGGSQPSKSAYGTPATDTSFRKTWSKEEYAAKAQQREATEKEESKLRYEAKLAGKTYHRRPTTPPDHRETTARASRLDVSSLVGKTMLVPAGAATGKRGRGAGFWCESCDLTFKDNLQWVEHLNSKQHLLAVGMTGEVKRASVEEVRERLRWLVEKRRAERDEEVVELGARLKGREELAEREREGRRVARRDKRRKKGGAGDGGGDEGVEVKVEGEGAGADGEEGDEMAAMMGFGGFGSTKV